MMFVASGLIAANFYRSRPELRGEYFTVESSERQTNMISESEFLKRVDTLTLVDRIYISYGFPAESMSLRVMVNMNKQGAIKYISTPVNIWNYTAIVLDSIFAIILVLMTYLACERIVLLKYVLPVLLVLLWILLECLNNEFRSR